MKNQRPDQFPQMHYTNKAGQKKPLTGIQVRNKLVRALLNKYYKSAGIYNSKVKAFLPAIERWKMVIAVNILCYKIRPDNPFSAWTTAKELTARILNESKQAGKNLKVIEPEGREQTSLLHNQVICQHCGELIDLGCGVDWHKLKNTLNINDEGKVQYK